MNGYCYRLPVVVRLKVSGTEMHITLGTHPVYIAYPVRGFQLYR